MEGNINQEKPIFIVGVPRSGTTLMRSLLSAHPAITISPESHFLRDWMRRYHHLDFSQPDQFESFWEAFSHSSTFAAFGLNSATIRSHILAAKIIDYQTIFTSILQAYAIKMNKRRWGEKTPDHYQYLQILLEWYPQGRVIWMLRDPRAVTASLIKLSWASSQADVHACKWRDSLQIFAKKWSKDERILLVKYEELVQQPEAAMRRVCRFLAEEYSPEMVSNRPKSPAILSLTESTPHPHYQSVLEPIQATAVEKWRLTLSPYQIAIIEYFTRDGMKQYGYQPMTDKPNTWQLLQLFLLINLRKSKHNCQHLRKLLPSKSNQKNPVL